MSPKFFAFAVFLLVGCQAIAASTLEEEYIETRGLQEEANKAIEKLKNVLEKAIADAKATLQRLIENIKKMANDVINKGKEGVQQEVDKVLGQIKDLKEKAQKLGKNIEKCIGDQETKIKDIPKVIGDKLVKCATDKMNEAIGIVNNIITKVENTISKVENLSSDLKSCKHNILCIGKVVAEAGSAVIKLPGDITAQIVAAQKFVTTLQADLTICATQAVASTIASLGGIVPQIVKCAIAIIG